MCKGKQETKKSMRTRAGFEFDFLAQSFARNLFQTGSLVCLLLWSAFPSRAETPSIPWECSTYKGDAQTRCLNTMIELQQEKIGELEGRLRAQEGTVSRLKDQIDRQIATTANLQQRLSDQQIVNTSPPFSPVAPYLHFYPPGLGFGIHFGSSWTYGPFPSYGPLWWNPPYYRPWRYRY